MNDERYILARFKMMLIDKIQNGKREYESNIDIYKEVLTLLNAIEITAVLNMNVDEILKSKEDEA